MKIIAAIFAAILFGCSISIPIPSEEDVQSLRLMGRKISLEELLSDRQLYISRCSGCHSLYIPSQYTDQEWNRILPVMIVKSNLSLLESEKIKRYISLFSLKRTGFGTSSSNKVGMNLAGSLLNKRYNMLNLNH